MNSCCWTFVVLVVSVLIQDGGHATSKVCWRIKAGHNVMGLENVGSKNLQHCLRQCFKMKVCQVVNWDTWSNPRCWIQTRAFSIKEASFHVKISTNSYVLDRDCYHNSAAFGCWKESIGHQLPGLFQVEAYDRVQCLRKCLQSNICKRVDWDTTAPSCWIQDKEFDVSDSSLQPKFSTTSYFLDRKCYDAVVGLDCWKRKVGYQLKGLINVKSTGPLNCFIQCLEKPICRAADWDTRSTHGCWIQMHDIPVSQSNLTPKSSVVNFILDKECYKAFNGLVPPNMRCWAERKQTHYKGLEKSKDINDLPSCIAKCNEFGFCNAIDMDSNSNPKCWLQTKKAPMANERYLEPVQLQITNYFRSQACREIVDLFLGPTDDGE